MQLLWQKIHCILTFAVHASINSQETTMSTITNASNLGQGEVYFNGQKIANLKNVTFTPSASTRAPLPRWPRPSGPGESPDAVTWLRESGETAESNGFTSQAELFDYCANLIEQLQQELAACDRERLHLATKIADERELIIELASLARKQHYYCEDSWYSCPKATDGCANDSVGDECNCGADEHNAKVDALMQQLKSRTD